MKRSLFLYGMLGLMTMASCSNDESGNSSQSMGYMITPVSQVNQMSRASQNLQSGSSLAENTKTGFFITDGSVTDQTEMVQDNILKTADGNGGFSGDTQLYFPLSKSAGIYAYAPYREGTSMTADNAFKVQTNQATDEGYLNSDLLIGAPASNPVVAEGKDNIVPVKFDHKLAKININVSVADGVRLDLSKSRVSILNTLTGCTFNIQNNTVTASGSTETITAANYTSEQTDGYKCAAIIVPQTVSANKQFLCIEFTSESDVVKKMFVRLQTDQTFVGGHEYTYNAKILSESVKLDLTGDLTPWSPDTPTDVKPEEGEEDVPAREPVAGDWYTASGKFVDGSQAAPSNAIGIVYTTVVSEADRAEGYKAYVSALSDLGNTAWTTADNAWLTTALSNSFVTTGTEAVNALDGLALTNAAKGQESFADLVAVSKALSQTDYIKGGKYAAPSTSSGWFVPSVGQMSLLGACVYGGEATIDETSVVYTGGYKGKDFAAKVLAANGETNFLTSGNPTYWTISESDASNLWVATFNETKKFEAKPASKIQKYGKRVHLILAAK